MFQLLGECHSWWARESLRPYSDVTIYLFLIHNIFYRCCMSIDFYDLSTRGGCWFVVYIRSLFTNFKCASFWLHSCCGKLECWARKGVNHTSWLAEVTPTDRPKSVRNRYVIELQYPKCAYGPCCSFNPIWNGEYILVDVPFYISTTWWVPLLVGQRIPKGTWSQVLRSTSFDSKRFESIKFFRLQNWLKLWFRGFLLWLQLVFLTLGYHFSTFKNSLFGLG